MSDNRLYDSNNGTEAKPTPIPTPNKLDHEDNGDNEYQPTTPEGLEEPTKPRSTNS